MKLAIMQPYFLPYIGYFQLIEAVNLFILYDNIKYTKKGWINRNRMLQNGKDVTFSLPLRSGSDYLDVCQRALAADFNRQRLLNMFRESYQRAPYFEQTFPLLERVVRFNEANLFDYLHYSIVAVCRHLGISTEIRRSSEIPVDHQLKGQDKVLALCEAVGARTYINSVGGRELYARETFQVRNIELLFIQPTPIAYSQFDDEFVPWLSIVDVLMFNSIDVTRHLLTRHIALS
jgi:WbqC-like protein family